MKRFKYVFTLLIILACTLSSFGCSAHMVKNGFGYNAQYFSDSKSIYVISDLKLYFPKSGTYEISYVLHLYYNGTEIATKKGNTDFTASSSGTDKIFDYWSLKQGEYKGIVNYDRNLEVTVTDLKIIGNQSQTTPNKSYTSLAISFGVIGGVVLISLIVLFVVFKVKDGKSEK